MNSIPSTKSTYVAASLLGGLIALLMASPARSAEMFRLDRIAIVQFSPTADDRLLLRNAVLDAAGEVTWRGSQAIARPADVPAWIFNRNLVNVNAWLAFRGLGGFATADFEIQGGGERVLIGDQAYIAVAPRDGALVATGKMINISTRTHLRGGELVIAGFAIEDRARAMLVRAVGPGLAQFNVLSAHPDPWLTIKRNGQTIVGNDDWENQADAALVERVSAGVGAFPLPTSSFDAAQVVMLPAGAYTVHVGSNLSHVFSGEILVEVYSVPEDVIDSN